MPDHRNYVEPALQDACRTAKEFMNQAVSAVNDKFGPGAADKRPELVCCLVDAMGKSFASETLANSTYSLVLALEGIAAAIKGE